MKEMAKGRERRLSRLKMQMGAPFPYWRRRESKTATVATDTESQGDKKLELHVPMTGVDCWSELKIPMAGANYSDFFFVLCIR